jgi:hypothetical protein
VHLANEFRFRSYGVTIGIESNRDDVLSKAVAVVRKSLLDRIEIVENEQVDHYFGITLDDAGIFTLYQDGERNTEGESERNFFKFFGSIIRLTVAEYAESRVFVHAGVVGWKGAAIVLPARSFQGKTTLVAELVRNGAAYYSDEYAIFDENGLVHSFPRMLAMRGIEDEYIQTDVSVDSLGGATGTAPIPVGMVLITEFHEGALWQPQALSDGEGVMEMIPHTIPIRFNPKFSLKVLKRIVNRAIIAKSPRNDAKEFSKILLNFFDNTLV